MTLKDIELVNMAGNDMVTAVVKGDIAAFAWDWLSAVAAQKQSGDDIVILDRDGIEKIWGYHLIFVANAKTVEERPDVVAAAVKTLFEAEEFIARDRAATVKHVAARTATSEEDTVKGIELLDIGVKLDDSLIDVMMAEAKWAVEAGIAQPYSGDLRKLFRGIIAPEAMRKIKPERVRLS
jgi:ABC-type nitrate/sulfonate/bicarbonate transport system substrate-binding protein